MIMFKVIRKLLLFWGIILFFACRKNANQTVETAYLPPVIPEQKYNFKRNGSSSVNFYQADVINKTLTYLFSSFLSSVQIYGEKEYKTFNEYYEGSASDFVREIKPKNYVATSKLHSPKRVAILADLLTMVDSSGSITGYSISKTNPSPTSRRFKDSAPNAGGKIGNSLVTFGYADARGLVVADAWQKMLMGAIYLDKILNVHLDEEKLNDNKLREDHQNLVLVGLGNYTELEHELDMAYGFYRFFIPMSKSEQLQILRGAEQKMINAFVEARKALDIHDYAEMWRQIRYIREKLSRLVAVHAVNLLVGNNTISNLKSDEPYFALPLLSQAYGLIYALQFTRKANGEPYFTYEQIKDILKSLLDSENGGLWQLPRLLGGAEQEGSLMNIATLIANTYGFSPEELR